MAICCSRDPDKLLTTSSVSYNIVRGSGEREESAEGEYETLEQSLPPPTSFSFSSQSLTAAAAAAAAAGDPLHEPV